jgi:HK97 family phage major capsid protein
MLRTRAMVARMGARILTGLTAPIPFAKQVSGMTMYWVGENPTQDVPDSDIGTGLVTLSPHTIMGMGIFGKQLLAESSIDVEEMIRQELGGAGARGMDRATVHGTGTNGEPTGIYVAPDVQVLDVNGVPDYGDLVDMQAMVADKDADVGSLGYMTTPLMAGVFKKTLEFSAAGSTKIWMGTFEEGEVAGYRATATNQVSKVLGTGADEHGLLYGNWNTVVIGFWNATEITVDPFTLMARAMVRIASFQMGDVILRHPQSFTKGTRCKIAA